MPLPIDSNSSGLGRSTPPPADNNQPPDNPVQDGAGQNGVRQRLGVQHGEYVIVELSPEEQSPITWCEALRLFWTSLSPFSVPGIELPRFSIPQSRSELVDIAMSVAGATAYGSVMRGGRVMYSMGAGLWNLGQRAVAAHQAQAQAQAFRPDQDLDAPPPVPAPLIPAMPRSVNINVEVESVASRDDHMLFSSPAAPLTPSEELPAPEPIARPRHPSAHSGRPSTDVNVRRRMRPDNFDSVRLLVAAVQQSSQFAQESMRIMEEADAREERAIAPDALDRLPQQVVCEVENGAGFLMDVSWINPDGSRGEEAVYCSESNSVEVPRHASNVYLDRFGGTDLSGRVLTRVQRHSLVTEGHIYDSVDSQAAQLTKLARILARDSQWLALEMVADHVLRDVQEDKAPEFVAQMREYKALAEKHRPPSRSETAMEFVGQALVGLALAAGIYTAMRWYQAYCSGDRGWTLAARPFMDMVEGVGGLSGQGRHDHQANRQAAAEARAEARAEQRALEELGAVGGAPPDPDDFDDDQWCDDDFFDYQ